MKIFACSALAVVATAFALAPAEAASYGVTWRANGSYDLPVTRDISLDSQMAPLPYAAPRRPSTTRLFSLTPNEVAPVTVDPRLSAAAGVPGETALRLAPEKQEDVNGLDPARPPAVRTDGDADVEVAPR